MEVFVQKNCTLAAVAEVWGLESGFLVAQTHAWRTIDQNSGMAPDLKQVDADLIVNLVYLAGIFTCFRVSTGYESEVRIGHGRNFAVNKFVASHLMFRKVNKFVADI
jgi:hypothetical protein